MNKRILTKEITLMSSKIIGMEYKIVVKACIRAQPRLGDLVRISGEKSTYLVTNIRDLKNV